MEYAMLIYTDEVEETKLPPAEMHETMARYFAFREDAKAAGQFVVGRPLQPTSNATTVRVENGQILTTDGPFAETKEQLGGFFILNCRDLDEAISLAAKIPAASSGRVEVRPIMVFG